MDRLAHKSQFETDFGTCRKQVSLRDAQTPYPDERLRFSTKTAWKSFFSSSIFIAINWDAQFPWLSTAKIKSLTIKS